MSGATECPLVNYFLDPGSAAMFLSLFVSSIENALMILEAGNVISIRLQMFCKGDAQALRESELMVSEKMAAFTRAGFDMMAGASNAIIRENFRAAIQANEARLKALHLVAEPDGPIEHHAGCASIG
jgi:hypothetical protein